MDNLIGRTQKVEHQQLQEQRLQLKQILEQQKKEQEEIDRIPVLKQKHFDYGDIQNVHSYSEDRHDRKVTVDSHNNLKSFHDSLQDYSSGRHDLQPLVPVQQNIPCYKDITDQKEVQLQELCGLVTHQEQGNDLALHVQTPVDTNNFSEEPEQQYSPTTDKVEQNDIPISDSIVHDSRVTVLHCTSPQSSSNGYTDHDDQLPSVSDASSTQQTCPLPVKVNIIGPESLCLPIKRNVSYARGPRDMSQLNYDCEWHTCTCFFSDYKKYLNHVKSHIDELSGLVCLWRDCGAEFQESTEFERHVYLHGYHTKIKAVGQRHQERRKLECCKLDSDSRNLVPEIPEALECQWEECELVFVSVQHFYWHIEGHCNNALRLSEGGKVLVLCGWKGCSFRGDRVSRVMTHSHTHTQEKAIGCSHCGAVFSTNAKLYDHLVKQRPFEELQFQCSACSKRFPSERLARDHFRNHINHWKCSHCDMTCSSQFNLEKHIHYRHTSLREHECSHCDKAFKTNLDLNRHLLTHTEHKLYRCHYPECDFKVKCYQTLDKHIKKEHLNSRNVYGCHVCPVECCSGSGLSRHLMRVHNLTWPSGHSRFMYRRDTDGRFRLQTVRYESLEMSHGLDENTALEQYSGYQREGNTCNLVRDGLVEESVDEVDGVEEDSPYPAPPSHASVSQEDDTSASGPHSTPFYSASAESSYYEQGSTPHSSFGSPSNPPDTPCSTPGTTLSSNHYQSTPTSSFGSSPCHQTTPTPLSSSPCHHATPSSNCPLLASQATPQSPTKTRKSIMNDERWNTTPTKSKRTRKNCDQLTPQRKSARTKNKKDDGDNEDKYENSQEFYGIMIPTKL